MKPIKEITALRLFFMLMIFIHHCNFDYGGGGCAVAGFFLISGFCMTLGYGEKVLQDGFSWKQFILKRAIKLYPIHWIGLIICLALSIWRYATIDWLALGLDTALLQSWTLQESLYFSYNSPSWYLCDLLFFSSVFPFLMMGLHKLNKTGKTLAVVIPMMIILALSLFMPKDMRHAWLYIFPLSRVVDCLIGIYLAWGYMAIRDSKKWMSRLQPYAMHFDILIITLFAIVIIQSITKFATSTLYQTAYWLPESMLLMAITIRGLIDQPTLLQKILNSKPVAYLGACSLSFYILHVPTFGLCHLIIGRCNCNSKSLIGGGIVLFVTFILARIFYVLIEQKLTKYLNNKLLKSSI